MPAQGGLDKDSDLLLDQLRAIDNIRLIQGPLMQCPPEFMSRVDEALREVLDILLA
ncbi:MAG: type II toxin-antitoxin system PemK/MazF family toxin [Proteobacteria bacterium]|nr:type II toxin-antitoxin system PemK/MazF family toxin [Pseudomonadota bacterium]